jgi:hypothetical protein
MILLTAVLVIVSATASTIPVITHRPLGAILRDQVLTIEPDQLVFAARQSQTVTSKVVITNVSGKPLDLLGVSSCCSCTTVTTDLPLTLEPGESRSLPVRMTVGAPDATGKFAKTLTFFVDRKGALASLTLEATVTDR